MTDLITSMVSGLISLASGTALGFYVGRGTRKVPLVVPEYDREPFELISPPEPRFCDQDSICEYRRRCDSCGKLSPATNNDDYAVRVAAELGWLVSATGDICHQCRPTVKT